MRHRIESNGTDDAIQGFNACTAVFPSDCNNVATGKADEVIEKRRNTKKGDAAHLPLRIFKYLAAASRLTLPIELSISASKLKVRLDVFRIEVSFGQRI
jgi:hypothetical protein